MKAKPLLSDIQTTKVKFNPGDRVLVRISEDLTRDKENKLKKSIVKFFGEDVRILFVNCLKTRLLRRRKNGMTERLADESYIKNQNKNLGVANLSCSKIDFDSGDQLICYDRAVLFSCHPNNTTLIVKHIKDWLKQWVGNDIEIIIMKEDFH